MPTPNQVDPFADYREWTEHRYDPGHYLGGTIPPHLRRTSLGRRARRRAGVLLMVVGVALVPQSLQYSPWAMVLPALWIAAGIAMFTRRAPVGE